MNCPACDHDLSARTLDNVTVDVCDGGCGGIWLDAFELARVDEELPSEIRDIAKDPKLVVDNDRKRPCPRCDGVKMQRHFYSSTHRVEVDSCPGCGGYWLDAGELSAIREDVKKPNPADGPVRVHLTEKKASETKIGGGGGLSQADRACTLDSLYRIIGSKY
jgi:Zn-finger nucleic acid-binding protein